MKTYRVSNDSGTESMEVVADSPEEAALVALNRLGWYVEDDGEES